MAKKRNHLVVQHLEAVHSRLFEEHKDVLREFLKGRHGVYALYKGDRLYYVGLASSLRSRLRHHLKDRHAGRWDHFSVYVTSTDDHLRELEALALRIASPKGNKSRTKFARSQDLKKYFRRRIAEHQRHDLDDLFSHVDNSESSDDKGRNPTLASLIKGRLAIRMEYKKKMFRATVRSDGKIRFKGRKFTSPSVAAYRISRSGHSMNGWFWWKYERSPGEWVYLDKLRGRRS
jgi:predicted GIY-YIG superfamily endonuclease